MIIYTRINYIYIYIIISYYIIYNDVALLGI